MYATLWQLLTQNQQNEKKLKVSDVGNGILILSSQL
jgi:hypothetical protein